jgi:hypothetical protein
LCFSCPRAKIDFGLSANHRRQDKYNSNLYLDQVLIQSNHADRYLQLKANKIIVDVFCGIHWKFMKNLLIKLYQIITSPIDRRLSRDMTLKLQSVSLAYIEQHERISAKMIDELTKLSVRLDKLETIFIGGDPIYSIEQSQGEDNRKMSEEKISEALETANISSDDSSLKVKMLEQTNLELNRLDHTNEYI